MTDKTTAILLTNAADMVIALPSLDALLIHFPEYPKWKVCDMLLADETLEGCTAMYNPGIEGFESQIQKIRDESFTSDNPS